MPHEIDGRGAALATFLLVPATVATRRIPVPLVARPTSVLEPRVLGVALPRLRTYARHGCTHEATGLVGLVDLLSVTGVVLVVRDAVSPHGVAYGMRYGMGDGAGTLPTALRLLPLVGGGSVVATATLAVLAGRSSASSWQPRELAHHRGIAVCGTCFFTSLAYWHLVDAPL